MPRCSTSAALQVCSVLQKRYWLPSTLYRYCRCTNTNCPNDWAADNNPAINYSSSSNNHNNNTASGLAVVKSGPAFSMLFNNRAQMKFCAPVVQSVPTCTANQVAVVEQEPTILTDYVNSK